MKSKPKFTGFTESIKNALFKNYFNIKGKSTRSEFWWFNLFALVVAFIPVGFYTLIMGPGWLGEELFPESLNNLAYLFQGFITIPLFTVSVRRCHDAGIETDYAVFLNIISFVGGYYYSYFGFWSSNLTIALIYIVIAIYVFYLLIKKSVDT